MPRIRKRLDDRTRPASGALVDRLADELRNEHGLGQPLIYEQEFPSGKLRVTVLWDEWDRLPLEERTETILQAYGRAGQYAERDRIALASGLTIPEAHAAGMLPYQIITALRTTDPVSLDQCRQAMIGLGASTLLAPDRPQLRFATEEEAEAAKRRLIERLPGSDEVWLISQDVGQVEEWTSR